MKKSIKTTVTIATIGILLVCAYLLGTTQPETITEIQTVTEIKEVIPDGYIPLDECIPLEDIACCYIGGYDYPCFELKDVLNQLDDNSNRSYMDIMDKLTDETADFRENFIDMRNVVDFTATEYGLQLYLEDGTGYYIKR